MKSSKRIIALMLAVVTVFSAMAFSSSALLFGEHEQVVNPFIGSTALRLGIYELILEWSFPTIKDSQIDRLRNNIYGEIRNTNTKTGRWFTINFFPFSIASADYRDASAPM